MFVVIAHTPDDDWSYGPFVDHVAAVTFAELAALEHPQIDYSVFELLSPQAARLAGIEGRHG